MRNRTDRLAMTVWTVESVERSGVPDTHGQTEETRRRERDAVLCCCSGESHQDGTSAREETALGILVEGPGRTAAPPPVRGWLWSSRGHPGADRPGAAAPSRQGCVGRRAGEGLVSHRAAGFNRATT